VILRGSHLRKILCLFKKKPKVISGTLFQRLLEFIRLTLLQLNKHETDPYFLQIFQSNMSVCLIIFVFCKSCEPICEPEITTVLYHLENLQKSKQNNFTFTVQSTNLTKPGNEHCHALEILKKIWICLAFI